MLVTFATALIIASYTDKVAHAGAGLAIAQVTTKLVCAGKDARDAPAQRACRGWGFLAGVLAGLAKEAWDHTGCDGRADWRDAAATAGGAFLGVALLAEW